MTEEERLLQEMMARQNKFYGRFNTTTTPVTAARPAVVTPRVSTPARTITNTVEQQKVLKDLAKSKSFKPSSPTTKWSTDAVSKVPSMAKLIPGLGAAATIYDAFRPSQLATAADATANPGTAFRVTQAYPSMDNVYTDPTAMAYAGVTPPGEEFGSSYAGPNTMGLNRDYDRVKAMFDSPVDTDTSHAYTGMGDLQSHPGQGTGYNAGFGTTGATYAGLMGEIANLPHSEVVPTKQGFFEEGSMIPSYLGKIASSKVDTYDVQNTPLYDAMVAINNQNPSNMPFDAPNVLGALTTGTDPLMDFNVAQDWANEINALRPGTWGVDPTTQEVTFEDYLTELGPASGPNIPFGKTTGTVTPTPDIYPAMQNVDYSAALASPTITAQDQISAYNAASMGEIASHPGQGGHIGGPTDPDITIPEMLARQDARTAAAVMAPRQQAMPEVSVPAPTAPTVASQAAQNRLAQQQADAAIARAAQAAAARDAARQAQQASAAQAQAAQKAAQAVLARMSNDRNTPSQREINAAIEVMSQVDTFDSGGQRGFMGAEVGVEDGGGYTGGDFSSGAGWE